MTKAAKDKIAKGLDEAISFAMGECEHDFVRDWTDDRDPENRKTYICPKCKVRITRFSPTD